MNMALKNDTRKVVVIGGGISGLATAYFLVRKSRASGRDVEVELLERENRVGGKFLARRESGFLVEGGPNGFLDSKPWTLDLARDIGLEDRLLPSDQAAARRFIFSRGKLHEMKASPLSFFRSNLLSLPGRVRILGELLAPVTQSGQDTSLAEFGRRRLGGEVVDRMLDPMVSGIFAGDPERMSLRASFPRIAELEEQYGGLIRAMFRIAAEKRRAKRSGGEVGVSSGPSGPGGVLTSFKGGVSELTDRIADELGDRVRRGCAARHLKKHNRGYAVQTDGGTVQADSVVLATPADTAAAILRQAAPGSAEMLSRIPYSPMAVVGLGYALDRLKEPPEGFGYLIPGIEGRRILGALWTSSIFPGYRSDEGHFLIRVMVGGAKDHHTPFLDDDALLAVVREEIAATMGLTIDPEFHTIFRWDRAIPLYTVGHLDRLTEAESMLPPGIVLTGNAYRGVGINDCVRESKAAAEKALDALLAL